MGGGNPPEIDVAGAAKCVAGCSSLAIPTSSVEKGKRGGGGVVVPT